MKLPPYMIIAYEKMDRPGSTGEVIYAADSIADLAEHTGVHPKTISRILLDRSNKIARRIPFEIRKVFLT